jgi:hypothetical protein
MKCYTGHYTWMVLLNTVTKLLFHKRRGICWLAECLLTSQGLLHHGATWLIQHRPHGFSCFSLVRRRMLGEYLEMSHYHLLTNPYLLTIHDHSPRYSMLHNLCSWNSVAKQRNTHSVTWTRFRRNGNEYATGWKSGVRFPALGPIQLHIQQVLGLFPRGWSGRGTSLTTHLHLGPKLRMRGAIPPFPNTSWWRDA